MDKQDPEEQRLEDKPMEPAEEAVQPSEAPVLSDSESDAPEPGEMPAADTSAQDSADSEPAKESAESEPAPEAASEQSAEDAPAEEETPEDVVQEADPEALEGAVQDEEPDAEVAAEGESDSQDISATEALPAAPDDVEDEQDSTEEPAPEEDDDPSDWFVVHCYSGYENKVRHNLEQRIETMGMKDMIFDVVVPTQEEIEVRDGKRRTVERHIFPGYVLVNMILTEESWYVVRNTPGVTGFVGMGNTPTPLRPEEVSQIVKRMEADAPTVKVTFKVGERVRIVDGPFNDFRGVVSEIDMERTKVRVMVSFFGRETPVELDFLQVEKS